MAPRCATLRAMTRARLLISLASLVALVAVAVLYASRDDPAEVASAPTPATVPASTTDAELPVRNSSNAETTPSAAAIRTRPPDPMAVNFAATDDLLAFIDGIQDAAQDGDGRAAYYLYHALDRCQTEYERRFGGGRHERSLDEVMTDESVVRRYGEADLRWIHGQCQRLRESDMTRLGAPDDWLLKAADAGYPRAQAEAALWFVMTGGPAPNTDRSGQARELARAAVSSKDPEVFFTVSRVIEGLNPEKAADLHLDSWYIAACLRGLDCGPGAEITRKICSEDPTCHPDESALDLLRRLMGERFAANELGAHQINAAIDAGRLEELGL